MSRPPRYYLAQNIGGPGDFPAVAFSTTARRSRPAGGTVVVAQPARPANVRNVDLANVRARPRTIKPLGLVRTNAQISPAIAAAVRPNLPPLPGSVECSEWETAPWQQILQQLGQPLDPSVAQWQVQPPSGSSRTNPQTSAMGWIRLCYMQPQSAQQPPGGPGTEQPVAFYPAEQIAGSLLLALSNGDDAGAQAMLEQWFNAPQGRTTDQVQELIGVFQANGYADLAQAVIEQWNALLGPQSDQAPQQPAQQAQPGFSTGWDEPGGR